MNPTITIPRHLAVFYFLVIGTILSLPILISFDIISKGKLEFLCLNFLLLAYLCWEIWRSARIERRQILIQPVVMATIFHFILRYIVPNIRYMTDQENWWWLHSRFLFSHDNAIEHLNSAMLTVCIAAFAMWRGYRSNFALIISGRLRKLLSGTGMIKSKFKINLIGVFLLAAASAVAIFYQMKLGVFGYSADTSNLEKTINIRTYLQMINNVGSVIMLVLSMAVYSRQYQYNLLIKVIFIVFLLWMITLGFLSGFKSQVIMPVIIVGVSQYVMTGKIPYHWIVMCLAMVILAYAIVEPFRYLRYHSAKFDNQSPVSIVTTVFEAATVDNSGHAFTSTDISLWDKNLGRYDLTTFTAQAITYRDRYDLPNNAPNFAKDIILAPLNAFVPRFIWPSKRRENVGSWFNIEVLQAPRSSLTSVAMGPVAYAYFCGGGIAVFLIFYMLGIIQRTTFEIFTRLGAGGWIIFLLLLYPLVFIPTSLSGALAGFLRIIPFAILAQYLILGNGRKKIQEQR